MTMAITPYNPGSGLTYQQWVAQQLAGMNGPPKPDAKQGLMDQAAAGGAFAGTAEGNYNNLTAEGQATRDYLGRLMRGEDSVSAEQLRQALQQNVSAQRSMAAGASPQNAAMAARTAAIQTGRLGSGLAGQQAVAGIAERNAAANALGQMQAAYRGQDVNAALGSRGNAIQGYGAVLNQPHQPSWLERAAGAIGGALSGYVTSDRRTKTEIADGDKDADKLLEGLKAYTYRYKDEKNGKGKQLGLMAQDLRRVLPQAVEDGADGLQINGPKLATALAAVLPGMRDRIAKLEREQRR
jgi:hypothetical protein